MVKVNVLTQEKFAATSQFTDDRAQSSSTKSGRKSAQSSKPISASHWRHGPAKLWYDQLGVPEDGRGFDYGFKLKENSQQDSAPLTDEEDEGKPPSVIEDPVPLEAFSMLANKSWEDDINYDTPAHTGPMKFAIGMYMHYNITYDTHTHTYIYIHNIMSIL